jgi:hypothetical protein
MFRVGWVGFGAVEYEPADEQPHPVPAHRLDVVAPDEFAHFLHGVGPPEHPEHPDPGCEVEGGRGVVPTPLQGRLHGHRLGVASHDRDEATLVGAPAQPQVLSTATVELEASRGDPYRQLSRVFHLVGRKRSN